MPERILFLSQGYPSDMIKAIMSVMQHNPTITVILKNRKGIDIEEVKEKIDLGIKIFKIYINEIRSPRVEPHEIETNLYDLKETVKEIFKWLEKKYGDKLNGFEIIFDISSGLRTASLGMYVSAYLLNVLKNFKRNNAPRSIYVTYFRTIEAFKRKVEEFEKIIMDKWGKSSQEERRKIVYEISRKTEELLREYPRSEVQVDIIPLELISELEDEMMIVLFLLSEHGSLKQSEIVKLLKEEYGVSITPQKLSRHIREILLPHKLVEIVRRGKKKETSLSLTDKGSLIAYLKNVINFVRFRKES